jgi:hypothetical protein
MRTGQAVKAGQAKKDPRIEIRGSRLVKNRPKYLVELAAAHAVSAVQAFITGPAADGNVSAGIAGRCITLHTFRRRIDGVQTSFCIRIFNRHFYRGRVHHRGCRF